MTDPLPRRAKLPISPERIARSLTELWSPRVIAELDDSYVKVAKVHGELGWHSHEDEDELFYVLEGQLRIEMEAGAVVLERGDAFVVPKGVRHSPIAAQECLIMLIERKTTLHTGEEVMQQTRSIEEQLRPFEERSAGGSSDTARVTVKLDDLEHAFLFVGAGPPGEHEAYLCIDTGEFHWHSEFGDNEEPLPEDVEDSERYIAVPHPSDLDLGRRLARRFAEDELPDAYADVEQIFRRRGAFGRFKALLERKGMLDRWYRYEAQETKAALARWCWKHGIELEE